MKFYDCSTAPSPRRVRIYIAEKGLSDRIETVEVNLREAAQMTPEFAAINPNRTVPVLETDDGARFLSTQGCWRYLEAAFPEPPLMGRTPSPTSNGGPRWTASWRSAKHCATRRRG